jgi:phosphate-selective porin OprO/OprP
MEWELPGARAMHSPDRSLAALSLSFFVSAAASPAAAQDAKPQKSVEERLADLEKKTGGEAMRAFWKDGMRFESADKRYKLKIGGRIHYDGQFFDPDGDTRAAVETGTNRIEDGTELRRARIELSGEVGERTEWAFGMDFGSGTTNFRNAYVGVKDFAFGNVRAGQFKEPYGLEQITSSNNILFIERSLMNALVPAFNAGFMVYDDFAGERATWSVGAFRTGPDTGEVSRGDGEWATTARVTGLPLASEDGREFVHVGLGLSRRSPTNDSLTLSSKPEANLAPNYITATIPTESYDLIGLEAAWVMGPFSLAGEYTLASIEGDSGSPSDPDFAGYYAQLSYFLTGESRGYRKAQGCFDVLKPEDNAFGEKGGLGAWELAARISSLDLTDDGIDGGELDDLTFGVNWYLNPNTRVMADYILADLDPTGAGADGDTNILAFRVQFAY